MNTNRPETPVISLPDRVERDIRARDLCQPGDRVLVACSGGRDSTALLDLLYRLCPRLEITIGVAHVDHRQRPGSAKPARLLRRRCRRWQLRFHPLTLDVGRVPPGASEACLRQERFAVLQRTAAEHGYQRVALGHTRDDQVETILMRILRGTGPSGLCGIPSQRARTYIRPLLECEGHELAAYLKARRLRHIDDPSNHDRGFLRNRIRHDILPLLRRTANPSVDHALLRLSRSASRESDLLDRMAASLHAAASSGKDARFPLEALDNVHDALRARLLVRLVAEASGPGANLEQDHLERLLEQLRQRASDRWSLDLPGRMQAISDGRELLIRPRATAPPGFSLPVEGPGSYPLPDGHSRMHFELMSGWPAERSSNDHVFFDGRQVRFPLLIRSVSPGDRIRPWGVTGSRKVARLLIDARVPRHERRLVPLLVCPEQGVLWVGGLRRSDAAPVTAGCNPVLSVQLLPVDRTELASD